MTKIFLISFDDGTVWDRRFVELLNKYGMKATFNLNSGLEDFVWYYEDRFPVRRQILADTVELYRGHEVASHSLHHHWLNTLTPPQLSREVGDDCAALKKIFGLEEIGFGVPFTACGEREVNIIKKLFGLEKIGFGVPFTACGEREIKIIRKFTRYIRLSEMADGFALPKDEYHIPIHGLYNDPDIREKIAAFAGNDLPVSVFVMAGHSYELQVLGHWGYMEELLEYIRGFGFENMTTMEFVEEFYPKEG